MGSHPPLPIHSPTLMLPDTLIADLEAALDATRAPEVPGAAVAILSPDGDWFGASGVSDLANNTPLQPDDRFEAGSITKTFIATAILQLVEEGQLTLEDTLTDWLSPTFTDVIPNASAITVRQLLNHTSGIADYLDVFVERASSNPTLFLQQWEPEQLVGFLEGVEPLFAPGESWQYANTNYILAGSIIEAVTGNSYGSELRSRIIDPLNLEDTFIFGEEEIPGGYIKGYWDFDNNGVLDDLSITNLSWAGSAGSLISNTKDLAAFFDALLKDRSLLQPETLAQMLDTIPVSSPNYDSYGLGIGTLESPTRFWYAHRGQTLGFRSNLWYSPAEDITYVELTNGRSDDNLVRDLLPTFRNGLENNHGGNPTMVQVSLSTTTSFDGDLNALVEDLGTALTVRFDLDEPAPEGGLRVYVDSEVEQIINRLNLPEFAFNPILENIDLSSFVTNFDNSGFALTIDEGATFGSFTISVFDNPEPDTFLPATFDGRVEAVLSLRTQDEVDSADQGDIANISEYTIDPNGASSTVIFADEVSQLTDTPDPDPPTPQPEGLQVSLFTGPGYLIEDEGTVSAHAFLATNGVIPEGGLVVSVDAPNLSEFDLEGISVEGGEIAAVRDGGFDLRMTEYTTLVNLPIAADGETETGETATFSLAAGEGYEIVEGYSGGTFNLVDTASDIPQGVISEPNDIIPEATDTKISPENPSFSGSNSIYFDIGNRYLNPDGTYTYIDYSEDVDVYKVDLSAGQTIAIETFDFETNPSSFGEGLSLISQVYDAEGNPLRDYYASPLTASPDKLFGGIGPFDENETDSYQEFTAPEDGTYYIAFGSDGILQDVNNQGVAEEVAFYDPFTPSSGNGNRTIFGDYAIEIDLLTDANPRKAGTPTPPVSNPNVSNPPTLSLTANPATTDSEGNFTNAVVEHVEPGGLSSVTFTIQAEGEIPEGGIEFVLNSNANLFDYISLLGQNALPSTIGGQSLGAFYNEDGIPTGIRLRIEEPTMTVNYETANNQPWFPDFLGNLVEAFEPLETDGAEDVTFFLQPGEGYEVAPDAGTAEVTYYDSLADVPPPSGGGDVVPEVGISLSENELIESEGTATTLTFTLSEAPPPEGVVVYLDSEDDPVVGSVLGQFNVLEAEISGGNFPVPNGDSSGFFFTITEQTATITLSAFNELTVPGIDPFAVQEGIVALNFALQPQAGYTIDPAASEVNLTIADNLDSQIQVIPSAATENDPESTTLIESEGSIGVLTLSLSAPPPFEGVTVSVSAPSLSEFDVETIEAAGGTIAAVRDDGFDITISEQQATIRLPIVGDGVAEGSETATFTLEAGEGYELNQQATAATFILVDTLDQAAVPLESELIGNEVSNSTLPEANVLGLSPNSPSVSIRGLIGESYVDLPEDVDFYSFNLEAGQTVSLDIDTEESLVDGVINFRAVVYPALSEILQTFDTELRLFDADGNELAFNNDGAAPDEDFSRDPFLEFTAEAAGTYYVGVSQLGNRNYDPFTARSGSGWTFPEVGVFNGFYDLTATLTEGDTPGTDLTGTDAADILTGDDSDNLLNGLAGDDIYTGGAGADQFVFAIAQGIDTITDFEVGVDQIKLSGLTPEGVKFFELSNDTLVLTNSNELVGVVQGVTGLNSTVFA
ncbi:MAG: serine hydrolase [Synechococcales bacterium]|nr:serine hydrolase [Synechococcales bacterium]